MAETLIIQAGTKEEQYISLLPQIKALIDSETDQTAILATVSAALKQYFGFFWVGFYLVQKEELVLGPFQGPVACMRIRFGKGVCGTAWEQKKTILVEDVSLFPGHIACSADSKSEVVVPILHKGEVVGVLDVDSDKIGAFDATDSNYLNELCKWLSERL